MKKSRLKKALAIILVIALVIGVAACTTILVDKKSVPAMTTVENGLSAYELAVQYGFGGTVEQWLDSLKGQSAYEIAKTAGYSGTEDEWAAAMAAVGERPAVGIDSA